MTNKIQTKDIPDEVLVDLIKSLETIQRAWVDDLGFQSFKTDSASTFDIFAIWPTVPKKVILSKLESLISKGVIDGCACGCRGDFETVKD